MKIGIAGCGGIGSNVAMHLVRSKISNLKLVDFDVIEESNLNRQFYFKNQLGKYKSQTLKENLLKIDETLEIEALVEKIELENINNIFKDCDLIVEAFDNKLYKKLLIETCKNKTIISANGIAGRDLESLKYRKLGNLHIVGDFYSDIDEYKTYSTKVMLVASIMANIVLDYLEDRNEK
ncbi:sulfur carrier protein ThiS adenylyltransferase ThiF [Cetobacterium sp. 2A]|uniref:sulfur carrier protein ThiS adenylyltransferase ThiF n=1 Tax=unclassified Cetobacterium TaxID=2630983 RepID=UPI00163CF6C6|nr:sulfur carrier protein ThiS adenylyltransferase ThiF [Cetobacterium sp. 2A]MBC2857150.1 sulfur carrier protein ThiS adenylyltransferase ThiF [Cetobacterium sp. 2A]